MRSLRHTAAILLVVGVCSMAVLLAAALTRSGAAVLAVVAVLPLACIIAPGLILFQVAAAMEKISASLGDLDVGTRAPGGRLLLRSLHDAVNRFAQLRADSLRKLREHNSEANLRIQLLHQQKNNIEAVIHSIRDGVVVIDACDRVVLANAAAEELFDFRFSPDQGYLMEEVIRDCELARLIKRSRQSRIAHVRHEVGFGGAPRPRTFDCVISCVQDEEGAACGVVAVFHDITREKEISQMKNDFVSHVSHELKTPLASISAYAEMLVDGEAGDPETMHTFCGVIQTQAARLNRMIEDILNISRIESGLVKVTRQPCSLAILAQSAAEAIKSYAMEKHITVNAPAPFIHDQVFADEDMLTQVVINLLSNAVKYTPAGGIVDISVEVDDAEGCVRLTVSDTGVGIPPDDLPHVFDKYYRVEANKKQAKGTGLGLNLVKQIVETVHGGRVFVASTPQEGSTFGFELPLAATSAAQNV